MADRSPALASASNVSQSATVMPRTVLQDRIWGIDSDVTENNLDVHIRLLRKKIASLNKEELIKTLRGVGYYVE